ncbi:NFYB/HAP3 family transcription factor subunit [Candidatus Woesearchaeota archaeon]|nr:NFYB/HAP3 family transcription factor subunit [Candidatus Woesearchaeota archaeon]
MAGKLLPLAAMEKIIKKACGGDIRVAESAKAALRQVLEARAEEVAQRAGRYSMHAGRKTVKAEDITLAAQQ